jgi:hypothetical protein
MENNKINSNTETEKTNETKTIVKKSDEKKVAENKKDVKKPYDLLKGLMYQNVNYII